MTISPSPAPPSIAPHADAPSSAPSRAALYTPREERANALTHAAGILLSLAFLSALLVKAQGAAQLWSAIAFGGGLLLTFTASTLYHAARAPSLKRRLRILDHASIYVLIAGTYTPYMVLALPEQGGLPMTAAIWTAALVGIAIECLWLNRPKWLIAGLYVVLGWCIMIKGAAIYATVGAEGFWLLIAGGASSTLGVAFYVQKKKEFMHALFHMFVFLATIPAYCSVYFYVFK